MTNMKYDIEDSPNDSPCGCEDAPCCGC